MIKWLKKKLGILSLARRVELLEKDIIRVYKEQNRFEKSARIGRKPQRYDQIERARKRRQKAA